MFKIVPKISQEMNRLKQEPSLFETHGRHTSFKKHDYLQQAGSPVKSFFYMTAGLVKCFYIQEGKELVLRLMADNSAVIAYSGFITGDSSSEYIQFLEPSEGILISIEKLEAARLTNAKVDLMLRYVAEQHYLSLERRLMMLHHKTTKERYLYFCKTMEKRIIEEAPAHCIASYLGVTPESFSRVKRQLNNC